MGVDFFKCKSCGEIGDDYSGHNCEGCYSNWCRNCDVNKFIYCGEPRCDLCFSTEPTPITKGKMLKRALELLGKTKEQFKQELLLLEEFSKPQDTYKCNDPDYEEHVCNVACQVLGEDFVVENETLPIRGFCCVARYKENKTKYCVECSNRGKKQKVDE